MGRGTSSGFCEGQITCRFAGFYKGLEVDTAENRERCAPLVDGFHIIWLATIYMCIWFGLAFGTASLNTFFFFFLTLMKELAEVSEGMYIVAKYKVGERGQAA